MIKGYVAGSLNALLNLGQITPSEHEHWLRRLSPGTRLNEITIYGRPIATGGNPVQRNLTDSVSPQAIGEFNLLKEWVTERWVRKGDTDAEEIRAVVVGALNILLSLGHLASHKFEAWIDELTEELPPDTRLTIYD